MANRLRHLRRTSRPAPCSSAQLAGVSERDPLAAIRCWAASTGRSCRRRRRSAAGSASTHPPTTAAPDRRDPDPRPVDSPPGSTGTCLRRPVSRSPLPPRLGARLPVGITSRLDRVPAVRCGAKLPMPTAIAGHRPAPPPLASRDLSPEPGELPAPPIRNATHVESEPSRITDD